MTEENTTNEVKEVKKEVITELEAVTEVEEAKKTPRKELKKEVIQEEEATDNNPANYDVNLTSLLQAGAHFGHREDRWNPKMGEFIFTTRNKISIINLDKTLEAWDKVNKYVKDIASTGGSFLFVGTKEQAKRPIMEAANACGINYVNNRWLGGTLSNFNTIKKSISKLTKLEKLLVESEKPDTKIKIAKKEKLMLQRQIDKLESNLGGIKSMRKIPSVMFINDVNKDLNAVKEARKLHIPVIALIDTNSDPDLVSFPIPSNDDSSRVIKLFAMGIAKAINEGFKDFESNQRKGKAKAKKADASSTKVSETIVEEKKPSKSAKK